MRAARRLFSYAFLVRTMFLSSVFIFILCLPLSSSPERNDNPIFGILAQERKVKQENATSYIAASYVKFLESAGARVVPVRLNKTPEEYRKVFNSINGILFPGGSSSICSSDFQRAAKIFYDLAIEAKKSGDYFPVLGTCLGFELLMYFASGEPILSRTNTSGVALPLNFTHETNNSRMFKDFPPEVMQDLASQPLTIHSHKFGVAVETYNENEELRKFYKVLSTNSDGKIEFLSTIEAYDYPFYGIIWHPEKNPFEWTRPYYPHSPEAIRSSFYMAQFIVGEARKNFHKFESPEEESTALIYNYDPVYTGRYSVFQQAYFL